MAAPPRLKLYDARTVRDLPQVRARCRPTTLFDLESSRRCCRSASTRYVAEELIDWDAAPDDPMFRLTFPQRGMLPADE